MFLLKSTVNTQFTRSSLSGLARNQMSRKDATPSRKTLKMDTVSICLCHPNSDCYWQWHLFVEKIRCEFSEVQQIDL